jgi:hypothetical protein
MKIVKSNRKTPKIFFQLQLQIKVDFDLMQGNNYEVNRLLLLRVLLIRRLKHSMYLQTIIPV